MPICIDRRMFVTGLAATGSMALLGPSSASAMDAQALETTSVRLGRWKNGAYCWASLYLAGELLRADGFTDVRYVEGDKSLDNSQWLAKGEIDFDINMPAMHIKLIEAGVPIKVLTGVHSGCFELVANDKIQSIMDLRGQRVAVDAIGSHPHLLLSLMANYVGLDPVHDIKWIEGKSPVDAFVEGKADAVLAGSPEPQKLREMKIGHTVVSNAVDRPWSQYFCCMVSGSTDYVFKNPVATKHVLRAILKSADLCSSDPRAAATLLVERGFLPNFDYAFQTLKETRHDAWREFSADDSLRFYALRMQETGMIQSNPQQIIERGSDWRFLEEIKRELKA
jgi:NitT/TauT family transport system substrate-binding protein